MSFNRYMEFAKKEPATHPQTGDTLPTTIVDLYFYNDHIDIMGFGTLDTVRPKGGVTPERIQEARQVMRAQGFRLLTDVPHRSIRSPARQAAMAR